MTLHEWMRKCSGAPGEHLEPSAEVRVFWRDTCLQVDPLPVKDGAIYHIGEDPGCACLLPADMLGGRPSFPLLTVEGGRAVLQVPEAGFLETCRAGTSRMAQIPERRVTVDPDILYTVCLDPWFFQISLGTLPGRPPGPPVPFAPLRWTALSLAAHAAFFLVLAMVPPDAAGMNLNDTLQHNRFSRYMIPAAAAPRSDETRIDLRDQSGKPGGAPAPGPSGRMGNARSPKTSIRMPSPQERNLKPFSISRDVSREAASRAGIISFMTGAQASLFPQDAMTGISPESALSYLVTGGNVDGSGYDGLSIRGTGRGGGGDPDGVIGVHIGRIPGDGRGGNCTGGRCGSPAPGDLSGHRRMTDPVTPGNAVLVGSLSRETIRRHIQRRMNEVRYCYEAGLKKNPGLSGRISVFFTIDMNGIVTRSEVRENSLTGQDVAQCIARVVQHIRFPPPPDRGTVAVTYPFSLIQTDN